MLSINSITSTGARAEYFDGVSAIDSTSRWSLQYPESGFDFTNKGLWAAISALLNLALDERQSHHRLLAQAPAAHHVTAAAHAAAERTANPLVARQARRLLNELEQVLYRMNAVGLPPLHAAELADGSLLLEWLAPDRRVGLTLDPQPAQSGWYLLADGAESCQEWGYLDALDWNKLIAHILTDTHAD